MSQKGLCVEIRLRNIDIQEFLNVPTYEFPKYTTQLMNIAGQNSQATRPRVVGQMSELIREFPGKTFGEWVVWYQRQQPNAIDDATDKIISMIENFKEASLKIDRDLVRSWVEDLVLGKTFTGLKFQGAILGKLAEIKGCNYRLAEPDEESQGIDGFVGEEAYSIKPRTYNTLPSLQESIEAKIIFYEKKSDGSVVFEIPEDS